MNDETTRLINEESAQKEQQKVETTATGKQNPAAKRGGTKGRTAMAAAGGFVAGAAVGAGATATAQTPSSPDETIKEPEDTVEEKVEAPEPDQAILANDEGIRYAHVNADNFNEAFAQARAQVGPGGVFEYNGKIYATYTAEEWNDMSAQERTDFQSKVFDIVPSHSADLAQTNAGTNHPEHNETAQGPTAETVEANAEMIAAEPVDNEIRVLGVETVQNENGQIMNVALVENNGDQAILIDVDNNGTIDVLLHDDNVDGILQESEVYDISGAGLEVADLLQAQAAGEGEVYYASTDEMPDYINDADTFVDV